MTQTHFIGRYLELETLNRVLRRRSATLIVIKGRRRIGKSRLAEKFAQGKKFYEFTGLSPTDETTAQQQRDEFARQLSEQLSLPGLKGNDWGDLFTLLGKYTQKGQAIILLDEISWLGSKDPTFLGKLKIAWDLYFKKNPKLILILCGSVSSWIEKNILSNTGFFGRIAVKITLEELPLTDCNALLNEIGFKGSTLEKFLLLAITGSIPWYIELIDPGLPAIENIKKLCFEKDGILVDEFKYIFHDLFGRRKEICKKIVEYLAKGPAEYNDISDKLGYHKGGALSEYLKDLLISGFISRDYTWSLKSGKTSNLSQFRLRDNYLRFYLKYIAPNLHKIEKRQFEQMALTSLPGWNSLTGLQLESLVLNNRKLVHQKLGIQPENIVNDNPYFQRKTTRQKGCQIDYLIQTQLKTLYICEIKFSRNEIKPNIIEEVQQKIERLKIPKGFSCVPVLIHFNEVHEDVINSDYFFKIINFGDFLKVPIVSH